MFIYVTSNLMNIQSKTTNIRLALKDIAFSKYVFEHVNSQTSRISLNQLNRNL